MARSYLEVSLRHVCLERADRRVLRDVSWTIRPGERWILAGENGSGKTQLLKLLAGSVWPTPCAGQSRRYRWKGESRSEPYEAQDEIAYLGAERQDRYERYGWNHTVEEIVGTGVHRTDIPLEPLSPAEHRIVIEALTRLEIAGLAGRRFLELSYGERRLTLLARALAARPRLLLLDELLNGLDAVNHARAVRFLELTARTRMPWVLATHRHSDVPASATHALVLRRGRIVFRGPLGRASLSRRLATRPRSHAPAVAKRRLRAARRAVLVRLTHATVYLSERVALCDVSLAVREGECWIIHGPNGAGKSTLLRTLYGDHAVAAGGTIERKGIVAGVPLELFKRRVGVVAPHLQAEYPREISVAETVQSGRHASIGLAEPASLLDRRRAAAVLASLGIAGLAARPLAELSYGQMRRVLFARALIGKPSLLLLDEPFAGLDGGTRSQLMERLGAAHAHGVALVMATHERADWPHWATHELELRAGRVRYLGPTRSGSTQRMRALGA